jgi:glycosyltransferase involved in cell wall biosynthesis
MSHYSVLVPVYNESEIIVEKISELMNYLDGENPDYEIIVCDNGSTDDTREATAKIGDNRFRFFSIPERGVGRAFKEMVAQARNDKIISIDVDLSSDLSFIPECVKLLDEYDAVVGSKKKGEQERRWYRTFISDGYIRLVKMLLEIDYSDYSIGTKGWRKSRIEGYVNGIDYGSSYVVELIYRLVEDGGRIVEVPVSCHDTRGSKFNLVHEIFYRLKNLIVFTFRYRLRRRKSP